MVIERTANSAIAALQRSLAILARLQQGSATNEELQQAVERLRGVDAYGTRPRRALQEDIGRLRDLGYDIRYHKAGGAYELAADQGGGPVPLLLTATQLGALGFLYRTCLDPRNAGLPLAEEVVDLFAALLRRLPLADQREVAQATLGLDLEMPAVDSDPGARRLLGDIDRAIRERRHATFAYRSTTNPSDTPKVHEVGLEAQRVSGGHHYLIGWSYTFQQRFPFRRDRIVPDSFKLLSKVRAPGPAGLPPRLVTVRYRLLPAIVRRDVSIHFPGQQVEMLPDGSAVITVAVPEYELFFLRQRLQGYGANCQVLEPPNLVAQMRETARQLAALYADEPLECAGEPPPASADADTA